MTPLPQNVADFLRSEFQRPETLREDDLTAQRAAKLWRCSLSTAKRRLDDMLEDGKVSEVIKLHPVNGNRVRVFVVKGRKGG